MACPARASSLEVSADEAGLTATRKGLSHERPLGISSSLVFLISVLIQGIGFVGNYFIAHHIGGYNSGLTVIGVAGLFLTIASTINGLADLRVGSAYTYYIARGRDPAELTGTYTGLRLGMVALTCISLLALAPLLYFTQGAYSCVHSAATTIVPQCASLGPGYTWALTLPPSIELAALGLFLLVPILWSPGTIYTQLWIARGDSARSQIPLLLQSIVQTSVLITLAFITPLPEVAVFGFAAAYVLGGVASAVYSLPAVLRLSHRFQGGEARRMFTFAWPLMGGLVLAYIWTVAPTFLVSTFSPSAVTFFLASNGFRVLLLGLPVAISTPLFPHLTNLHVRREYEALRRRTWAALRYTAMVVVPAAIAMVVYRSPLLNTLFVHSYAVYGQYSMAILAVSAVPAAFSQIILTALTSVGRQRLDLYLQTTQVAVLLVAGFLLLPPYGPFAGDLATLTGSPTSGVVAGASFAVLLSSLAGFGVNTLFMERILAVRIQPRPIITITFSAAVSFAALSVLNDYINPNRWFILIPAILLGFLVYYVVLALTGEMSKQDARSIPRWLGLPAALGGLLAVVCWRNEPRDAGELLTGELGERSDLNLDQTRNRETGDSNLRRR